MPTPKSNTGLAIISALAIGTGLPLAALAQDGPDIPVIMDEPPGSGLPEGTVLDIRGIELGMTPEEVSETIDFRLDGSMNRVFIADPETGNEFDFSYPGEFRSPEPVGGTSAERRERDEDILRLEFGSPGAGGRVVSVQRYYDPGINTKIGTKGYRQAIIDKYGEPSAQSDDGNLMAWIYTAEGQQTYPFWSKSLSLDETELQNTLQGSLLNPESISLPPCALALRRDVSDGLYPYDYQKERAIRDEECVAVLQIDLAGDSTLAGADFHLVDQRRRIASAEGLDRAIEATLKGDGGPVTTPEL